MSDYFHRLETELAGLTERGAHLDRPVRGPRPRWMLLAPAIGLAVAVVVAALILVSLKPDTISREPAVRHRGVVPGEVISPLGSHPTLRQLLANFAVLRRPQTAADRSWRPAGGCCGSSRQLYGLTRRATVLSGGYRVFLDVEQFTIGGQRNLPAGSYVLSLDIIAPNGNTSGGSYEGGSYFMPLSFGGAGPLRRSSHSDVFAGIVPDGVSSVTWTFGCQPGRAAARFCAGNPTPSFTVPVVNNVAAAHLPGVGSCAECQLVGKVVWRGPDGRVVASFPQGFGNLPAPPFLTGGHGSSVLRVLAPNGVGNVLLGQSSSNAIQGLSQLLGTAADTNVPTGGCGIDHESVWASPASADPLTIFERRGRFVGYQYGAPVNEIGLQRGPGAVLTTPKMLMLGDTIRVAKRLYRNGFETSAARGVGRWRLVEQGGILYGYVLPTIYPLRRVIGQNPVATIDAGDTGCSPRGKP